MMKGAFGIAARAIVALKGLGRFPGEVGLHHEQASILFQILRLYVVFGTGTATLFTCAFDGWAHPRVIATYAALLSVYGSLFAVGIKWRHDRNDAQFVMVSNWLLLCLGCVWGILINLFASACSPDQKATLVGLAMALVSAPILCVPLLAAMAFFVPVTLATLVVIFVWIDVGYAGMLSFLGYLAFSFTGILYTNTTTMDRLVGRLNLQREHEIVRVFLREYEEVSTDWLWETDTCYRLRNVSPRMAETLQVSIDHLEQVDLARSEKLHGGGHGDYAAVIEAVRSRSAFRDRAVAVSTKAGTRWLNITGHPVHDGNGVFRGYRGIASDITAARLDQQRIEFMARHDGLTQLLSRRAFVLETDAVLARHSDRGHALVLIDLDDFKHINDDLGHAAGDTLLETVAARLLAQLGPDELAARIGGDEFALLITLHEHIDAMTRAAGLVQALQIEAKAGGSSLMSSASIGIALAPEHGASLDQLMRRADFALYEAKNGGKSIARLFEMHMENAFLSRQRMLGELGAAIEQNQIVVEYQPIMDIGSGQMVSAEALVRWMHPVRGLLSAGEFVPAAEASDLIEPLGARVLRLACDAAMGWDDTVPVSVNLSPRQLRSGRFVPTLVECLAQSGLPSHRLILEVTETVFLDAASRITQQLDRIRSMGVRLVLDDFGTGYSSLTYLHRFEVDGIKIDASFVRDLPSSLKVGAIVRTIGRLASDMNIYVTAEGVETEEQLRWLRGNGIAFAQGFLLGRPARNPTVAMADAAAKRTAQAGSSVRQLPKRSTV